MDHDIVKKYWEDNAMQWQEASDKGYDIWRDHLNTPAFLEMLPDISALSGIDIGYGDGYNSRLVAKRCAMLTAIDISDTFLSLSQKADNPHNISYRTMNATELRFPNEYFDFAVATMSFMDLSEIDKVFSEIYRVLAPSGFLQFSILHPCFNSQKGKWMTNEKGERVGFLNKNYFRETCGEVQTWQHFHIPDPKKKFQVPRFSRPLNKWLNMLIDAGFYIEQVEEPYANDATIQKFPELHSTQIVAHSLIIRARKDVQKKQPLRKILDRLPGNVWWKDKDLVYLGCNDRVIEILGLASRSDFIGKTDHDLWEKSIADKLEKADRSIIDTGKPLHLEEVIIHSDGTQAIMLTNKTPLFDDEGNLIGILGISTDITERKHHEEALRQAKEQAEEANYIKMKFIRNMEHDIRTPFNGIWGLSNYLWRHETDSKKKEYLGDITQCAKELLDFCNDILDFSKIESGNLPLIAKKFEIKKLINSIITVETPPAKHKSLTLTLDYSNDMPKILIGDKYRLYRILINLVSNAIKFTNDGGVVILVKPIKVLDKRNVIIQFTVKDSGIGIPSDKQDMIYEKFARLDASNKGQYKGIGLGLRIVKQFLEEMEGEISVNSQPGVGSEFTCTIPFKLPLIDEL